MKIMWSEKKVFILKQTYFIVTDDMQYYGMHWRTNWCSAKEQLPEDGLVRLKHVVINCDFNDILK
jgi:hypothetical protein